MQARKLEIAIVCAIVLVAPSLGYIDCTPESQEEVLCEYSLETGECPDSTAGSAGTPLQPVDDIEIYKYLNNVVNYTGVKISWSPPNAAALLGTTGYILNLYATKSNDSKELILCRYFNISLVDEVVGETISRYTFTYLEQSIPLYNTHIDVQIISVPVEPSLYAPSMTVSEFTTYGNPVDRFNVNGSKAEWSLPYTATVLIKHPGYDADVSMLYNFTKFRIILSHTDRTSVFDINGFAVDPYETLLNMPAEYIEVTFTKLVPSQYRIEVRPYIEDLRCFGLFCQDDVDAHQLSGFFITVSGYEYQPTVNLSLAMSENTVEVSFEVAPSYLYIIKYEITLSEGDKGVLRKDAVEPEAQDDWHVYKHRLVIDGLDALEELEAKILPVVHTGLCIEPGLCNLNGTCLPCQETVICHAFHPLLAASTEKEENGYNLEVWHVVIPVCGTAVAIATIAAGVYIYKKPVRHVEDNEQLSTIPENRVTQYEPDMSSTNAVPEVPGVPGVPGVPV
ncbi:uncharacterized protein [Watersipora subatra]|uniref:uncharacterized protein n=1 Tax=Watersipora subatra TaxID=2589382 RepID=UPI00355BDDFE